MVNLGINDLPIVTHCMSLIIKPRNGTFPDGEGEHILSWSQRFEIICDVASGLCHLHGLQPEIIHRDIKPQNILLDHSFRAKITDFGTIFAFPGENTHFIATSVIGTR
jgi:serine/threonine protein kinase